MLTSTGSLWSKQVPHAWYEPFRQSFLSDEYAQSMTDYVMFRRSTPQGIVLLILYVDDMVITRIDPAAIASLKQHLQFEFELKDLSFLHYFVGIELAYSSCGYLLSQ